MKSQLEKLPINVFFNILPFLESKDIENLHVAAEPEQDDVEAESSSSSSSGSTLSTIHNDVGEHEQVIQMDVQMEEPVKKQRSSDADIPLKKRKTMVGGSISVIKPSKVGKKKGAAAKTYPCPICDHVSSRSYNLTTHIKTHDRDRVKEFGCSLCKKRFDRRHDRERHLASVHRNERSFTCQHCAVSFSRRDALDRHFYQKHQ